MCDPIGFKMSQDAKPVPVMAIEAWEDELTANLAASFPDAPLEFGQFRGQEFVTLRPDHVLKVLQFLRDARKFNYFVDLTVVDYPTRHERFEVVIHLYSLANNRRIRLKSSILETEEFPSVSHLFPAANWLQREAFDMFGVRFSGHPNLKRMLLPDDWEGHPLRKEKSIVAMDNDWVRRNLGIESGQ
jgi:NADH-quinone oxidoreductase subunit C